MEEDKDRKDRGIVKKEVVKNIIIVALLLMVGGFIGFYFLGGNNKTCEGEVLYRNYHDDLIKLEHDKEVEVIANVLDKGERLAVYMKSSKKDAKLVKLHLNVTGKEKEEVYVKDASTFLGANGQNTYLFELPTLTNQFVREIKVSITLEEAEGQNIQENQFRYSIHRELDEMFTSQMKIEWQYLGNKKLDSAIGSVTLFQNNQIVGVYNFAQESIEPSGVFEVETVFPGKDGKALEYDRTEAFISYYEEAK